MPEPVDDAEDRPVPEPDDVPSPDEAPDETSGAPEFDAPVLVERPTGRARLIDALRHPSRSQLVVGVLLALVGFAGVVQIKATENDTTYAGYREQDLIDAFEGLSSTTQRTQAEIDRLRNERADLQSASSRGRTALESAQEDVDALNVLAGLVPVTGPGVRITITEETGTVGVGAMLDLVQELRAIGAEAIQLNGAVRVVAQTSFEQGVGGLLVNGQLVGSPYVVDAIGLSSTLAGAVNFPLGPRKTLESKGATVEVVELGSLDVDAVREPASPDFAQAEP